MFSGEKNISPKRSENENGENSEDEKDENNKMEIAAIPSELADESTYLLLASGQFVNTRILDFVEVIMQIKF